MNRRSLVVCVAAVGVFALGSIVGSMAVADPTKDSKAAAGQPEIKLPPGWTEADMQACMAAATPGKMHEFLAKGAGNWKGKSTMWMTEGAEPMSSECTSTVTPMIDGRFIKVEITGEMPGMGPYSGYGLYGFDNVSQKFVASWIDNCTTNILQGTGELSPDRKTLTWKFTVNCPIQKKPVTLREVETITSDTARTLEVFCTDPKSGKEYRTMKIEYTKAS